MITLILGGARSGKSALAERLVTSLPAPIIYVATMVTGDAPDDDLTARIAAHRARRPAAWGTIEAGRDLPNILRATTGSILLDSLGPWAALHDSDCHLLDGDGLCRALVERTGDSVVVSEEVGFGVHPSSEAGRLFRDQLGRLNQLVAAVADKALLVVAGRVLPLEKLD